MDRPHELAIRTGRVRKPSMSLGWKKVSTTEFRTSIRTRIWHRPTAPPEEIIVLRVHQSREVKLIFLLSGHLRHNGGDRQKRKPSKENEQHHHPCLFHAIPLVL